jgi:heme-degrading monooxygenase HmoA
MEENVGLVILINKFSVNPEEFDLFLKGWSNEAEKIKEQPGFISTQLHRVLVGAVRSLTMQFGNLPRTLRGR